MDPEPVSCEVTLETLNNVLEQLEIDLQAPLMNIGNGKRKNAKGEDENCTLLWFNDEATGGAPTPASVITTVAVPAGATVIDTGEVCIEGKLTKATAYRPA